MFRQMKWFERKFTFDFPTGIFPCFLERLRGTPARLEELVNGLPPDILSVRKDNSWSIQEHAGHLLDLEVLGEQRLADYRSGASVLTPADITNRRTHEANHNSVAIRSILKEFRMVRHSLVGKLEELNEEEVGRSALHPRLNTPMRVVDWCYFMAEHDDHHLTTIRLLSTPRR
jgi:hypothetical protein